ncbi:50S ribosomal protein L13 [archaeon]|jgi:large subunit ribosomal protein L13|nr:50S ribosomal protein L13 [archaeon]
MKILDGKNAVLGRLASFAAKEALLGEEINVINCDQIQITGNKKMLEREFMEKRSRYGHSQKGPKHHKTTEKIVKRAIRGMLPDHREGRGRVAFKKIKCYNGTPKEFENLKIIKMAVEKIKKSSAVKEFLN